MHILSRVHHSVVLRTLTLRDHIVSSPYGYAFRNRIPISASASAFPPEKEREWQLEKTSLCPGYDANGSNCDRIGILDICPLWNIIAFLFPKLTSYSFVFYN